MTGRHRAHQIHDSRIWRWLDSRLYRWLMRPLLVLFLIWLVLMVFAVGAILTGVHL